MNDAPTHVLFSRRIEEVTRPAQSRQTETAGEGFVPDASALKRRTDGVGSAGRALRVGITYGNHVSDAGKDLPRKPYNVFYYAFYLLRSQKREVLYSIKFDEWLSHSVVNLATTRKWAGSAREIPHSYRIHTSGNNFCGSVLFSGVPVLLDVTLCRILVQIRFPPLNYVRNSFDKLTGWSATPAPLPGLERALFNDQRCQNASGVDTYCTINVAELFEMSSIVGVGRSGESLVLADCLIARWKIAELKSSSEEWRKFSGPEVCVFSSHWAERRGRGEREKSAE
ncbi:hypothetical protein EVAR_11492_1 [Eumeta japonica]|uniref:Uncharacterized protein n=1 Tax=Eumeta variegata TaxID=151549 RepID=A0A4C1TYV1_EUMVA|nr:hypothetical protein EVAR_11492_1 [Eumeta japonica]